MTRLDVRGLKSPAPVLRIRRKLLELPGGDILEVTGDDPDLVTDLPAFCRQSGHRLIMAQEVEGMLVFQIAARKREPVVEFAPAFAAPPPLEAAC